MNIKKTLVMILTEDKEEKEQYITINGSNIKHNKKIKILGTIINENLNWNDHINEGSGSLISQFKQRMNSLILISKSISIKFARQMANALLMSKVNYNIEIWGDTSKTNRNKIDNIIYKAANIILGKEAIGRTKEWKLTKLKWLNIETNYRNAMQNSIYRMINSENNHDFKNYLTKNRNVRNISQNKTGHHDQTMGHSAFTQRTYLYRASRTSM